MTSGHTGLIPSSLPNGHYCTTGHCHLVDCSFCLRSYTPCTPEDISGCKIGESKSVLCVSCSEWRGFGVVKSCYYACVIRILGCALLIFGMCMFIPLSPILWGWREALLMWFVIVPRGLYNSIKRILTREHTL